MKTVVISKKYLPLKTASFLLVSIFIYAAISIGAYLVIVASQLSEPLMITKNEIMCVTIGGVIHQICKEAYEAYDLQPVDHSKDSATLHNNSEESSSNL